jgi:acyl carrier protein
MTRATLHDDLKAMIASLLEIDNFGDEDHFLRDLRADSMLIEEAVVNIERRYKIQLPNERLGDVRCLTDLVRVVGSIMGIA